ncbi:phosphopantothenoylcysteine decarboxylase/phosphopantothenate--cysteine ligase [Methanoregula boonei 6A8]|jgi:phosphopantothenoylcysteine decarboxylase/phosphopantothenate--cysteine ligase|uniref:Coenzyme A biosynthesis bifunctional protein CoaBC n=1 Tax=Methanoregula boonei (strain DSM 21154 / JCM 14090 / 6A8) TaxID=456442 RepID=A7I8X3_METB6|nr:bifunctional phosphopantothenoylcysteine decarboxylase/phosphopantothenate--cysteine ligase CoaBC [Methanoregula boonei]ABS56184.1 phosphopantothenoylcysteine decarboxylase/phosphopantothenate--cysteine ligase [Methanoregula boonei 6A8]
MTQKTLAGKEIVLAVTGSIAAVETVKLVHALRRKGATVQPVMSAAAQGIIHPDALTYASGRPAITRITGLVEHVTYCGDGGSASLLLVAPCTANTLGKIACGIDDTPVTTFATTALGSGMPVLTVPAMHHSMYRHPAVVKNIETLVSWGVGFVGPRIEEEKAKIADIDEIVLRCERTLIGKPLAGKNVLITGGACREPVDDVRVLTTRSSGRMGKELALAAYRLGAEVTLVHNGSLPCVENVPVETARDMRAAVTRYLKKRHPDIYISAAAISDFAPEKVQGKIKSGKRVTLDLAPIPKLIDTLLAERKTRVVAFKIARDPLPEARAFLARGAWMVVTNTPESMGCADGSYRILSGRAKAGTAVSGTKEAIAARIWDAILEGIKKDTAAPRSRQHNS